MTQDIDEPPPNDQRSSLKVSYESPHRIQLWPEVSREQWDSAKWQSSHAITSVRKKGLRLGLEDVFHFDGDERRKLLELEETINIRIPPYVVATMGDVNDPLDPIRLQVVPSSKEIDVESQAGMLRDPLGEEDDSPVPYLTHRYPDRALLTATSFCQLLCRFCTRSRETLDKDGQEAAINDASFQKVVEYVRENTQLREIIVSGGDPLTLPDNRLKKILMGLSEIPHLTKVRIGSRVPVTLPQRLYEEGLLDVLREVDGRYHKLWVHTHFNHPYEFTADSARAIENVRKLGINLKNHSVLLKGVNDDLETMKQVLELLELIRVDPYYWFQCDPVTGGGHFRTPLKRSIDLIDSLGGNISGAKIPKHVVDLPYGGGKVQANSDRRVALGWAGGQEFGVFVNFEGGMVFYNPQGVSRGREKLDLSELRDYSNSEKGIYIDRAAVLDFIHSGKDYTFPENSPRMQRRRAKQEREGFVQSLPLLTTAR